MPNVVELLERMSQYLSHRSECDAVRYAPTLWPVPGSGHVPLPCTCGLTSLRNDIISAIANATPT